MELRFTPALAGTVDLFQRLIQQIEAISSRARSSRENRDLGAKKGSKSGGAKIQEGCDSFAHDFDAA